MAYRGNRKFSASRNISVTLNKPTITSAMRASLADEKKRIEKEHSNTLDRSGRSTPRSNRVTVSSQITKHVHTRSLSASNSKSNDAEFKKALHESKADEEKRDAGVSPTESFKKDRPYSNSNSHESFEHNSESDKRYLQTIKEGIKSVPKYKAASDSVQRTTNGTRRNSTPSRHGAHLQAEIHYSHGSKHLESDTETSEENESDLFDTSFLPIPVMAHVLETTDSFISSHSKENLPKQSKTDPITKEILVDHPNNIFHKQTSKDLQQSQPSSNDPQLKTLSEKEQNTPNLKDTDDSQTKEETDKHKQTSPQDKQQPTSNDQKPRTQASSKNEKTSPIVQQNDRQTKGNTNTHKHIHSQGKQQPQTTSNDQKLTTQVSSINEKTCPIEKPDDRQTKGNTNAHKTGQRDLKPNKNLEFYQNKIKSDPFNGAYIEEMLKWKGNHIQLERNHRYIQWLFPISESSGMNPNAQSLQYHEAEAIRSDDALRNRVVKAYGMMLDFYGLELCSPETGEVRRSSLYKERFEHLNKSTHNYLRITRILKSLGELGFEHFQVPWLKQILEEAIKYHTLPRLHGDSLWHWIDAISKDQDRHEIITTYETLIGIHTETNTRNDNDDETRKDETKQQVADKKKSLNKKEKSDSSSLATGTEKALDF